MDYIFGSNQQPQTKPKSKELHQSITLKDDPTKTKELTPLQKLKIQQKRKLMLEKIQNQFDQRYGDSEENDRNGEKTKQLREDHGNQQHYDNNDSHNDRIVQPITHQHDQPVRNLNDQLPPSKQLIRTPIKQQKPLNNNIKQSPLNNNNKSVSKLTPSPKPIVKQHSTSKLQSPPKIHNQLSPSPKKNQPSPIVEPKDVSAKKQVSKATPRIRTKQNITQKQSNSVKKISLQKKPSKTKLNGSSQKQLSPKKDLKVIKQQFREEQSKPNIVNKPAVKPTKTIEPKAQPKYRGFSKQQKPVKSSLSITQAEQEIRKSIKQMKQSKAKQPEPYNFANQSFDPNTPMDINALLEADLGKSQRGLRFLDKKLISDSLADVDNLVYNALTSSKPGEYLKGVYHNIYPDNQFIKSQVDDAVNGALYNVNKLIVDDAPETKRGLKVNIERRIAPKDKDDLKQLQKLDKYRLIKIKEGQVKNKVGDLRTALQKEYFSNKNRININTSDLVDTDYYSMNHPQTIKAQNLIKQLNQRRRSQHRQYKEILTQKQLQKQRIKEIEKQYESIYNQQKKQKLRQYYEQKHLERELQKEQLKQKQQQFKDWIRMYERQKPLEEKLQDQMVMKFIVPEIQERHKKLLKIKQQHKPIDIEQINQHDHRYMEYKRDQRIRQKAQLENKVEQDNANQDQVNRYYKGKYRYLVLESMYEEKNMTDPKDIERSKKERQLAYSDQVKYVHKSLIRKKQEQQEDTRALIRRVRNHNGSVDSTILDNQRLNRTLEVSNGGLTERNPKRDAQTIDTYAEGIKNLQYAKSHVRQKLMNGQEKKPKIQFIGQKIRHRDYLVQLRQQRQHHSSLPPKQSDRSDSLKNKSTVMLGNSRGKVVVNDLSTTNDVESLKARVDVLDERLKRKQVKLRHARDIQTLADTQIENEYVEAINAKIKLVQELK